MKLSFLALSLAAAAITGCTMSPKFDRPTAPVAQAYPATDKAGVMTDVAWREFFTDPRLQDLIGLALTNNRDLRVAVLNVELSRTQYRIQRSALLPSLDATGSGSRQRTPGDLSGTGKPVTSSQYSVSGGVAAYELDLFGRVRSLKAQALEQFLATDANQKSARMALVSELATQYLTERELEEQLVIVKDTLKTVQSAYDLNRQKFDRGATSELDLQTSEAQVQTAKANMASLQQQLAQVGNALVLLVGCPIPENLPSARKLGDQSLLADLPAGLPSDLLQRRPDILAAEHTLRAANANIGAARAAFFPTVTLTASGGTASAQLSDLFTGGSGTWLFNPQISIPIFNAGRNSAELKASKIRKQIEIANYEKSIQTAFREVADGLSARANVEIQLGAEEKLVQAEQRRFDLATARYHAGTDSYLTVLSAQQDLYAASQNLVQTRFERLSNLVGLYKALGGGWK